MLRGVRGAIRADDNERNAILDSAEKVMHALIAGNGIEATSVAAVFFTLTPDLNAAFPAEVRSRIGWNLVPFLCEQEVAVPGAMQRVLRVLILFETDLSQDQIVHAYLGEAAALRPDLKGNHGVTETQR